MAHHLGHERAAETLRQPDDVSSARHRAGHHLRFRLSEREEHPTNPDWYCNPTAGVGRGRTKEPRSAPVTVRAADQGADRDCTTHLLVRRGAIRALPGTPARPSWNPHHSGVLELQAGVARIPQTERSPSITAPVRPSTSALPGLGPTRAGEAYVSSADAGLCFTRGVPRPFCFCWRPDIGAEGCVRIGEQAAFAMSARCRRRRRWPGACRLD